MLATLLDSQLSSHKSATKPLPAALLPEGTLWPEITQALLTFDPVQARYVGPYLLKIVEVVYLGAEQTGNYLPAIQILSNTIQRLDPSSSTLSTTHYYLIKACVLARAYSEAVPILDRPIYHIPTADSTKIVERRLNKYPCSAAESTVSYINPQTGLSGEISTRIFFEYYLLGAICYIGTRQWNKAQAFLEVVLVAPYQVNHNTCSAITVEAYKKWLLLGLLIDGNGRPIPAGFRGNALRYAKVLAKPYECVVEAFRSRKLDVLQAEIQEGMDVWAFDANTGLVLELVAALSKFEVARLGKTFAAVSIEEVSRILAAVQPNTQKVLDFVQSLIQRGELEAEVVPSQHGGLGIIRFLPSSAAQKSEAQVTRELAIKSAQLQMLLKRVTDYDHQLEVSRDYLDWLQKAKKARDADKKASQLGSAPQPTSYPPAPVDMDEDMMEDY